MTDALQDRTARVLGQIDLARCSGCDACALRCAAGVQMSREEYRAVKEYAAMPPHRAAVAAAVAQAKGVDLGDGVTVELCRFRDQERGRCVVYPVRPLVCRLLGHVEWLPCPVGRVERPADTGDALALMRAYAEHERRTWEDWDSAEAAPTSRKVCTHA